jgi:D-cysteine desulfhydrase family pyridoxal phosphate-dependent enzyme
VKNMNNIPRKRIAHLPTPIEEMPRLSAALGGPRLVIKRDDQTGLAFGGNKTRKLEFLLAEAESQSARTIITAGAVQSNHCRQTAAAAARFGFDCILVLYGDRPDQPTANLMLDKLFNAEIVWTDRSHRDEVLKQSFDLAETQGRAPYLAPYGGSSPTGALGYAFAMDEFIQQDVHADWILFASSSGGTQAGLVLGARLFGYRGHLLGISIDEPQAALQTHCAKLASEASEKVGERVIFAPNEVEVNAEYCSAGYGVLTDLEREAVRLFAKYEGLLLDPVYTGRAAGGMINLIRQGFFKKNDTVLFWHTGGSTALFADKYQDLI